MTDGSAGGLPADGTGRPRGRLFVLSGPSGVGKSTVLTRIRELLPGLWYSVSATTRRRRPGERDGVNYHFVTDEEFADLIANGRLLEHAHFAGHHYGTPRGPVEDRLAAGDDVLLEIDWQGAQQIKRLFPQTVTIFILPPPGTSCASACCVAARTTRRRSSSAWPTPASRWRTPASSTSL